MTILKKAIISITILLLLTDCKQETFENKNNLKVILPNNHYVNKEYIGKIIMKYPLDTIELKKKDLRSTSLLVGKFKSRKNNEFLEKIKDSLDIFGKIEENNDTIYFKYKFSEIGVFFLEGLVEDIIYLDKYYSPNSRLISNTVKISEKILVEKK